MATTAVSSTSRNPLFALGSTIAYVVLAAALVFLYLRGLFLLIPFWERVLGGIAEVWPRFVPVSPVPTGWLFLILVLLLAGGIVFRVPLAALVLRVPAQVRGLVLPLPVFFLLTGNYVASGLLALLSVATWILAEAAGLWLRGLLRPVPRFLWAPLGRFWPAILYAALFSRSITATLLAVLLLWIIHYLDRAMESAFAPVWDWHRTLPWRKATGLLAGRLLIGLTAPYVLSYSLAWFNPLYDRTSVFYGLGTALACFFITRGPGPRPAMQPTAPAGRPASPYRASGVAVLAVGAGFGLLAALGMAEVAHADDCSGPSDCAGTTWFNNAGGNAQAATGTSLLGSLLNWLFPEGGKFVGAIQGVGTHARERIISIGGSMDPSDKADAFDAIRPDFRGGARNFDEFMELLRSGKLDNQAAQIESDLRNSAGYAIGAQEAGATVGQILHTEGGALVSAGVDLNVKIIKTVLAQSFPGMEQGFDYADKVNEWANYVEEVYKDPLGKLKEAGLDEVKGAIGDKIKESLLKRYPNMPEEVAEQIAEQIGGAVVEASQPGK